MTRRLAPKRRAPSAGRDTSTLILDTAERLFAERGYDGTSLRDITSAAAVPLALATYHFKTKEQLFLSVFERRAGVVGQMRLDALAQIYDPAARRVPSVEQLVEAFLRPMFELVGGGDPGWRSYARLVAIVAHTGLGANHRISPLYDEVARRYLEAFGAALPRAERSALDLAYYFMVGAMLATYAQEGRLEQLSDGRVRSDDFAQIHRHLIPFVAAGFRASAERKA